MPDCLSQRLAKVFKEKLTSGEIDPVKVSEMTSTERHNYFSSFLGKEEATKVNTLFEKQNPDIWNKAQEGVKPVENNKELAKNWLTKDELGMSNKELKAKANALVEEANSNKDNFREFQAKNGEASRIYGYLDKVQAQEVKTEPKKVEGFTTGRFVKGTKVERSVRDIKSTKINSTDDIVKMNDDLTKVNTKLFQDIRGGKKTDVMLEKEAEQLGYTLDKIKKIPENALLNDAQNLAVLQLKSDKILQLAEATKAFAEAKAKGLRTEDHLVEMRKLYADWLSISKVVEQSKTQAGRALRSLGLETIPKEFDMNLADILIGNGMDQVSNIKDAMLKSKKLEKATLSDLFWSNYYFNMLSGIGTHIKNLTSTLINVGSKEFVQLVNNPLNVVNQLKAFGSGLREGKTAAGDIVLRGQYEGSKFGEGNKPITSTIGKVTEFSGKLLSAEDKLLSLPAQRSSMSDIANSTAKQEFRIAKKEGKTFDVKAREKEIMDGYNNFIKGNNQNLTPEIREMIDRATQEALTATYNNKDVRGVASAAAKGIASATSQPIFGKPIKFIMPFTRIVGNVVDAGIDWTPLGFLQGGAKRLGEGDYKYANRELRQTMTKAIIGTMGMGYLGVLATSGKIQLTGSGPSNTDLRKQLEAGGDWQRNSIKIGSNWYSYENLGSFAIPLSLLSNYIESVKYGKLDEKTATQRVTSMMMGSMGTILDASYLQGLSQLFKAVQYGDGSYLVRMAASTIKSSIPIAGNNLLTQISNYFEKDVKEADKWDFFQNLQYDMGAWARTGLNSKLSNTGEPIKNTNNILTNPLNVIMKNLGVNTKEEEVTATSPILNRMSSFNITIPIPDKTTKVTGMNDEKSRSMTDKELYEYKKIYGKYIKDALIYDKDYLMNLDEEDLKSEVSAIKSQASNDAKSDMGLDY